MGDDILELPPPSNSDHQGYYIFNRESLWTFICDCYWGGVDRNDIFHLWSFWSFHLISFGSWNPFERSQNVFSLAKFEIGAS